MIFSQYRETCEVLLDYPKIGGDDVIENYTKKGYHNPFACKYWYTQQNIDFWFPKTCSQIY